MMPVTFEAFYKLFTQSKPDVRYSPEHEKRGWTLDKICGDDLIMESHHNRDATLEQVKRAIAKKAHLAVKDSKSRRTVVFLCATEIEKDKVYYEVEYHRDVDKYFKR